MDGVCANIQLYKGIYTEELIDEQWQYQDRVTRPLLGWTMDIICDTHIYIWAP
jgi:hypothetical protein